MTKQAFVIPRAELVNSGIIPQQTEGRALYVRLANNANLITLLDLAKSHGSYGERGGEHDVEHDPSMQQIIVYGYVVMPDGRFMLYKRGSEGYTEGRLAGKVSLGLGGHMEPADLSLMDAFYRELDEETTISANGKPVNFTRADGTTDVGLMQKYVNVEPTGLIKDERDDVGIVHLGVACRLSPKIADVTIAVRAETGENVHSFFVTPEEYTKLARSGEISPEGWTDIVFREEFLGD